MTKYSTLLPSQDHSPEIPTHARTGPPAPGTALSPAPGTAILDQSPMLGRQPADDASRVKALIVDWLLAMTNWSPRRARALARLIGQAWPDFRRV